MMSPENLPKEIFTLLEEKPFDELTESEMLFVIEIISKKEYKSYRSTIKEFKNLDHLIEKEAPKFIIPDNINPWYQRVREIRLPIHQVAAGFLLFFMAGYFYSQNVMLDVSERNQVNRTEGKSILEDGYPQELVFNF